jgi:predicted phosphatase
MQNQGDMSRSWTLAAFASRTLVSLNYHSIDSITLNDETKRDMYGSLYTCYYLDKMLSVLLLRSPSLPKLKIKPTDLVYLDSQLPLSASVKTMVEFAQIQEGVLDILNHTCKNDQVTVINQLLRDMHEINALIKKVSDPCIHSIGKKQQILILRSVSIKICHPSEKRLMNGLP